MFFVFIIQFLGFTWIKKGVRYYYPIFPDSNLLYSIVNIVSSYLHAYGPHSIFFLFGFLFLLFYNRNTKQRFALIPTFLFPFFVFDTGYFLVFYTYLFSIIAGYGFLKIFQNKDAYRSIILMILLTYTPILVYFYVSTSFMIIAALEKY